MSSPHSRDWFSNEPPRTDTSFLPEVKIWRPGPNRLVARLLNRFRNALQVMLGMGAVFSIGLPLAIATPRDQPQIVLPPLPAGSDDRPEDSLLYNGGFDLTDLVRTESGITSEEHAGFGWVISANKSPWQLDAEADTLKMVVPDDYSDFNEDMAAQIIGEGGAYKGFHALKLDVRNSSESPLTVLVFGADQPFKIFPSVSEGPEKNRKEPVGELLASFLLEPDENQEWQHYAGTVDLKDGFRYVAVTIEPPRYAAAKGEIVEVDEVWLSRGAVAGSAQPLASSKSSKPKSKKQKPVSVTSSGIDLFEENLPPYSPAFELVQLDNGQTATGWRIGPGSQGMAFWSVLELDASERPNLRLTLQAEQSVETQLKLTVMSDPLNRLEQIVPVDLEAGESKTYTFPLVQMRRFGIPTLNQLDRIELEVVDPDSAPASPTRLLLKEASFMQD